MKESSDSSFAIEAEGLSKRYRIGYELRENETLVGAVASAFANPWKNLRRIRSLTRTGSGDPDPSLLWALRDISFRVPRGETVGVIGRNGAGKSTLLKILARITHPSEGRLRFRGRVASLLEVGTGFHPELTGKENVFLNGSILGMTRQEIHEKFDEIASFSEIEPFLDTPVKRFSSGMKLRLAFAVAAHLDPEILLVDEILAVGDVAFQKKCLGRLDATAQSDRTVLFVSHDLNAVQRLCSRTLLLDQGQMLDFGPTADVVERYLTGVGRTQSRLSWDLANAPIQGDVRLLSVEVQSEAGDPVTQVDEEQRTYVTIRWDLLKPQRGIVPQIVLYDPQGALLFVSVDEELADAAPTQDAGRYVARCRLPTEWLNRGIYDVRIDLLQFPRPLKTLHRIDSAASFQVVESARHAASAVGSLPGIVRPQLEWAVHRIDLPRTETDG